MKYHVAYHYSIYHTPDNPSPIVMDYGIIKADNVKEAKNIIIAKVFPKDIWLAGNHNSRNSLRDRLQVTQI